MSDFKVGDKVKIISTNSRCTFLYKVGMIGYLCGDSVYHNQLSNSVTDIDGAYWIYPEIPIPGYDRLCIGSRCTLELVREHTTKGNKII